jgi:hypothetical protein
MQLVSSYIRVEAYGITESRYYVILFGVFSIVSALMLIFNKKKNPNLIVLLSAIFALISIIPPVDAFTVSKNSQESRLSEILMKNEMLVENKIIPKDNVPNEDKFEITNITDYLARMGYLKDIEWFPEDYTTDSGYYKNFEVVYGFSPYYNSYVPDETPQYIYARLDENEEIDVSGYDKFLKVNIFSNNSTLEIGNFTLNGDNYSIKHKSDGKGELIISVFDNNNDKVIEVDMKELINNLIENVNEPKSLVSQENLTIIKENANMKLKIIANELNIDMSTKNNVYVTGNIMLFIAIPQ